MMLWTIISESDIFYSQVRVVNSVRSSNPYDYIRKGYYVDNASYYGGKDNVDFNSHISGNRTSSQLDIADI